MFQKCCDFLLYKPDSEESPFIPLSTPSLSTQSTGKSGGFCLKNITDPVSYSHSLLVHGASKDGNLFLGGFIILLTDLPVPGFHLVLLPGLSLLYHRSRQLQPTG